MGRFVKPGDGTVLVDWESVTASFFVTGASTVQMYVQEGNGGGQRWAVYIKSSSQTANLTVRTGEVWTSPNFGAPVTLIGGWSVSPAEIRVMRTVEPCFNGAPYSSPTRVVSFLLDDGSLSAVPAPPTPPHRIEILGDSITAGMGNLGLLSSGCGGSGYTSDYSYTYGQVLCSAFGAECSTMAWSGISLVDPSTGPSLPGCPSSTGQCTLPNLYPFALASQPGKNAWNFGAWKPEAVHINLGAYCAGSCVPLLPPATDCLLTHPHVFLPSPSLPGSSRHQRRAQQQIYQCHLCRPV